MKINIFGFKKNELIALTIILSTLLIAIFVNLKISFRKARDAQRKGDIRSIYDALLSYHEDFGFYPDAIDGMIAACEPVEFDSFGTAVFSPCRWGWDELRDVFDDEYPKYLTLPSDPHHTYGTKYLYVSDRIHFQIYAALESDQEDEYSEDVVARDLKCGEQICNFGRSDGKTPLDKSLEEYENELIVK